MYVGTENAQNSGGKYPIDEKASSDEWQKNEWQEKVHNYSR